MIKLKDIATEMDVGTSTVSYVLNGKWREKRISEGLASKILGKAGELNYQPNLLGRHLRTQRTNLIGIIFTHLTRLHYFSILKGIESNLTPKGYSFLFSNSNDDSNTERQV